MKQDENGFTRLKELKGFDKFVSIFKRMAATTKEDPNDCLYKDYDSKTFSTQYGELDFAPMCEAEVFLRRVRKHFPTGWMLISTKEKGKRKNLLAYVYSYEYANSLRCHFQTIVVYCHTDTFGKLLLNVDDLETVAFHSLTEEEIKTITAFGALIGSKPSPIYKLMALKPEYKKDYKLYLSDCEKYGFKPIEKKFLKRIELNTIDGKPTTFTPDGLFGYLGDDDQVIINE